MKEFTTSGFPKNLKTLSDFLLELEKRGASIDYVELHNTHEKGTGLIHNLMWEAAKQQYVDLRQNLLPDNSSQFRAKLRLSAIAYLENKRSMADSIRKGNINTCINIAVLIVSILGVIVTIYLHYYA